MSQAHPTVEPAQTKTDTFAVFADSPQDPAPNLVLVKRVEVPRYSEPTADGVELGHVQRVSLAVNFAVMADDSAVPVAGQTLKDVEGEEFMVMTDMEAPMAFATFERDPVDGAWNPNTHSVEEYVAEFGGDA